MKLGMLAVLVIALGVVYVLSTRSARLPEYFKFDLDGALRAAKAERRPVVVLFWSELADDATRYVVGAKGLRHQQVTKAVDRHKYLCVAINATAKSKRAVKYGVKTTPALVVLSPDGLPLGRLEGRKGHSAIEELLSTAAEKLK
ncbi:MAG: hypothetical protein B1H04_02550 [Planctomycetales bacterium 4484_123]|nr:MAG: hypothetical protein B1H04_02550 [Planctomycetales bacterium 4484_123]